MIGWPILSKWRVQTLAKVAKVALRRIRCKHSFTVQLSSLFYWVGYHEEHRTCDLAHGVIHLFSEFLSNVYPLPIGKRACHLER